MGQQIDLSLALGELLLLVCIIFDLITFDCTAAVETYSLRSCPRATVAFVSLILADACFLYSYLRSPTHRLSAHWRHLLLFVTSSCILAIMIVLHSLGSSYILDTRLRYYFGSILGFALLVTWVKTLVVFPLNLPPVHPAKLGPHAPYIGTHSFSIPIFHPDDPGATYPAAVQVWFPLPQPPRAGATPSLLWTSGNPSTQGAEAHSLLESICKEFNQVWFILSHLALSRHSNPPIFYSSQHHHNSSGSSSSGGDEASSSGKGDTRAQAQAQAQAAADMMGMMEGRAPAALSSPVSASASSSAAAWLSGRGPSQLTALLPADLQGPLASHPVAIYSHGMFSWRQLASSTVAHLVSHGFVVFALDHGPSAMVARIPCDGAGSEGQGQGQGQGDEGAEGMGAEQEAVAVSADSPAAEAKAEAKAKAKVRREPSGVSTVAFDFRLPPALANTPGEHAFYNAGLERRTVEVLALMDFIDAEHRAGALRGYRLDPSRLHLFGHSFGSGTVANVCARDARPLSAVLLDSWLFPLSERDMAAGSKRAHVLSLASALWDIGVTAESQRGRHRFMQSTRLHSPGTETFQLKVLGTDHQNFCDIYMLADKALLAGMLGPVDPYKMTSSLNALVCEFFQRCHAHAHAHADPDAAGAAGGAAMGACVCVAGGEGGGESDCLKIGWRCESGGDGGEAMGERERRGERGEREEEAACLCLPSSLLSGGASSEPLGKASSSASTSSSSSTSTSTPPSPHKREQDQQSQQSQQGRLPQQHQQQQPHQQQRKAGPDEEYRRLSIFLRGAGADQLGDAMLDGLCVAERGAGEPREPRASDRV